MREQLGGQHPALPRRGQANKNSFPSHFTSLACIAAVFCQLAVLVACKGDDLTRVGRSLAEYRPQPLESAEPDASGLLVVTLLDGRVVAVRPDSGELLWTYDTGTPLVTVKQGQAMAPGLRIFPGVDGGLYAYGNVLSTGEGPVGGAKLERLPITLPELVETSPSLTDDGSVIVGKRLTRVYVLDRATGALLQSISEGAAAGGPPAEGRRGPGHAFGIEDMPVLQMLDMERVVLVGREDFVVRSMQVQTGLETWNATYSRMIQLGGPMGHRAAQQPRVPGAGLPAPGTLLPYFTVGADHTLQAYDPASRRRRWTIPFDTPPVGVFGSAQGSINFLDPQALQQRQQQEAVQQQQQQQGGGGGGRVPPLPGADGLGGGGGSGGGKLVLLGVLGPGGGMYAMPADHLVLDDQVQAQPLGAIALPGPSSAQLPQLPGPPSLPASAGTGAVAPGAIAASPAAAAEDQNALALIDSSRDVVTYMTEDDTGEGVVSGLSCHPRLQLLTTVDEPSEDRQPLPWLPDAAGRGGAADGGGGLRPYGGSGAAVNGSGGGDAATDGPPSALLPGGALLSVVLLAAGAGAATVLVVMQVRGGGSTAAAAAAAATSAGAGVTASGKGATAAAAGSMRGGGTLDVDAVAAGVGGRGDSSGGKSSSNGVAANGGGGGAGEGGQRKGGGGGGGGGQRRRKGRAGGDVGGALPASREVALPKIDENEQLVAQEPAPAPPASPPSALASFSSSLSPASPSPASAPHLPSAEARVRVLEDGSLAIGRLRVGPGILGYGSAGTIVYEGDLDGRPVAVKRLLRQFTELARKEIEVLILSDEHPNVVRCFAMEEDREFVYLALERCRSTLSDFLDTPAGRSQFVDPDSKQPTARCTSTMLDVCRGLAALHERGVVHRDLKPHNVLLTETSQRAKLSDMGLSKQLVPEQSSFESHHGPGGSSGWQAPEQLIARDGGAARQTRSMDVFSLGCILYYCMTGGRHPFGDNHYERDANILHGSPSLAALAASAGHEAANLVAACLAKDPGRRPGVPAVLGHPLWWSEEQRLAFLVDISDRIENEDREPDTSLLEALESFAIVALSVSPYSPPLDGPTTATTARSAAAAAVTSTSAPTHASTSAAAAAASALVPLPNWGAALPPELVANLGRYRRYDFTSLRDLLRVVRNKRNHFREMPQQLQTMLGPLPGGFLRFFAARFPRLLLSVYVFALQHLAEEPHLQQYWRKGQEGAQQTGVQGLQGGAAAGSQSFVQTFLTQYAPHLKPIKALMQPQPQPQPPPAPQPADRGAPPSPPPAAPASQSASSDGPATATAEDAAAGVNPTGWTVGGKQQASSSSSLPLGSALAAEQQLLAGGQALAAALSAPDHSDLLTAPLAPTAVAAVGPVTAAIPPPPPPQAAATTATVYAGNPLPMTAVAPAPPPPPAAAAAPPLVVVGYEPSGDDGECHVREFPRRPGKQLCDFYSKTGHCKFGDTCVFDHPETFAVHLTALGLPLRPGEPLCSFYLRNNECRFGPACKFHHPLLRPVFAGSATAATAAGAEAVATAGADGGGGQ